jgi:hypothetical protein
MNDQNTDPAKPEFERAPADADAGQNGVDPAAAQASVQQPTGKRRTGVGVPPAATRPPGRPKGKAGEVPEDFDPLAEGAPKWSGHEAETLWPELLQWLEAKKKSPYDVMVNVIRIEPPTRAQIGEPFEAHACQGDGTNTPSAALKFMVEEFYHLQSCRTPARYELQFVWRANGQYVTHAYISLASPAEIIALRNAAHARRMYVQSAPMQAPGLGRPPASGYPQPPMQQMQPPPMQPPQQQPYPYQPPPFGYYGYPPQPQQPQRDPDLERRLAALEDENRRLRAGQSVGVRPGMGAPPPAAPAQQAPITTESLATAVVAAIRAAGLGSGPPQDMITGLRTALGMVREIRHFADEVGGVFEPEDPQQRPIAELPAPAEVRDDDNDPYDVTDLPTQWDDGSKGKLVRNKETGQIDLLGLALYNPRPAQKLIDAGAAFLERFGKRGLGETPEQEETQFPPQISQQQPQPAPQQQLPPPSPPPNPSSGGGQGEGWGGF